MNDTARKLMSVLMELDGTDLSLLEVKSLYANNNKVHTRDATQQYYDKHLNVILGFLKTLGIQFVSQLDKDALNKYVAFEKSKGNKNNTINKRLGTLRQALKHCYDENLIASNPMERYKNLPKDDVETKTIPKEYLVAMYNYFLTTEDTLLNLRTHVMFRFLIETGIRLNELRNLKIENLDLINNQAHLTFTKTNESRDIFFDSSTSELFAEYQRRMKPIDYFICSIDKKEQLSEQGMYSQFDKIKRKLNIPQEVSISFHKFRHTYATMCLDNNADLEFIRKTLGHSTLRITQKYLHVSNKSLQEQHSKCNPILNLI